MMLLSFTVRNHRSIRDEVTLDLVRPSLRTLTPKDGNWHAATYPLAGIFGGNATGKSSVLDAFLYVFTAINRSATTWQNGRSMYRAPFRLGGSEQTSTSSYELDFVHDGRRHLYGFEVDIDGIVAEWLHDIPNSRWRVVYERRRDASLRRHPSLQLPDFTQRELVLSRARLLNHPALGGIADALVDSFDAVLVNHDHREARVRDLADALAESSISFDDVQALLQIADIGVVEVGIEERDTPAYIRRAFRNYLRELRQGDDDSPDQEAEDDDNEELDEDQLDGVARRLTFVHRGTVDRCPPFSLADESDGTIAWLALVTPALERLRNGGLLVVDEIDASLHPHLVEVLLAAFADPHINTKHAQLVFTSHETHVLSPLSEVKLEPEQVWFTDKTGEGVTELTCLADFPKHPDANVAKRYLAGRYGGTPRLAPSILAALVDTAETD